SHKLHAVNGVLRQNQSTIEVYIPIGFTAIPDFTRPIGVESIGLFVTIEYVLTVCPNKFGEDVRLLLVFLNYRFFIIAVAHSDGEYKRLAVIALDYNPRPSRVESIALAVFESACKR